MKIVPVTCLAVCVLALAGCASTAGNVPPAANATSQSAAAKQGEDAKHIKKTDRVQAAMQRIHRLYNKSNFGALYALASERIRQQISRAKFVAFMQRLRTTLGAVRSAKTIARHPVAAGKKVVVMKVQYRHDTGTERWVLQFSGDSVHWTEFFYNAPSLTGQ